MATPELEELTASYWDNVNDAELVGLDLIIDNPLEVEGLVTTMPLGDEDPHVESSYDRRGTGEDILCIHGHHHQKGLVFRKGNSRFLVGHQCGEKHYGIEFHRLTSRFAAVVHRRDTLVRVKKYRDAVSEFTLWLSDIEHHPALRHYQKLRGELNHNFGWIYDHLCALAAVSKTGLPKNLTSPQGDIRKIVEYIATEVAAVSSILTGDAMKVAGRLPEVRAKLDNVCKRSETLLSNLQDVEKFFQPAALDEICEIATREDNPRKRRYRNQMFTLFMSGPSTVSLKMPDDFNIPSDSAVTKLRTALS